ncbi:class I SAM-dependent methyltransferase [Actinomadura luteofluorescens]|uniref:class I SAM-dependent methyltransferase n=1 Tax=Actinomadura luteofluorescens TaxID=46163 RepID=UPI0036373788
MGRAGPAYERGFAHVTRYMIEPLLDAAGVADGTRLLDVGTGPGFVSREAARRGALVSAMDAEPGMAETALRNVPGLDVKVAVLPDVPFEDGTFDAVAATSSSTTWAPPTWRLPGCGACCARAGGWR